MQYEHTHTVFRWFFSDGFSDAGVKQWAHRQPFWQLGDDSFSSCSFISSGLAACACSLGARTSSHVDVHSLNCEMEEYICDEHSYHTRPLCTYRGLPGHDGHNARTTRWMGWACQPCIRCIHLLHGIAHRVHPIQLRIRAQPLRLRAELGLTPYLSTWPNVFRHNTEKFARFLCLE